MTDTSTAASSPTATTRPSRGRGAAAVIAFIIASLLFPLGLVGFWGQRTLIDTEQYVTTVAPLSSNPAVKDTVASLVSDQVVKSLDVGAALGQYLPAQGQVLVGPLTSALDNLIDRAVRAVMNTEQFQKLWVGLNTAAQKSFVALLEGKQDGPIQVNSNGQVVLDTTATYQAVRQAMVNDGVPFAASLPEQPKNDKQVVLFQSEQIQRLQTIYSFAKPIMTWLIILAIVLFIAAIALSRRRPRMLLAVGISVIISAVLLRAGLEIGADQVNLALADTPLASMEAAFYTTLTRFLLNGTAWALAIGVALAAIGWLFGRSGPATAIRRWAGAEAPHDPGFGGWLRGNAKLLALAIGVIAVVILLALNLTVVHLFLVVIAVAVIGGLLWYGTARKSAAAA